MHTCILNQQDSHNPQSNQDSEGKEKQKKRNKKNQNYPTQVASASANRIKKRQYKNKAPTQEPSNK